MAFPSSPLDGQQVIVSNVTYSYNATKTAWYRVGTVANPVVSTVNAFTGDGSRLTFTLNAAPASENYTFVAVGGVMQPRSTYTVLGTDITFSSPPPVNTPVEITTFGGTGGATYSNNSVATYLPYYTGNVSANSIIASSFYWSNGAPFSSSVYGDSNVAAYIAGTTFPDIYTANLSASYIQTTSVVAYGNITAQGNILPLASNVSNLGSPSKRFGSLYLAGNTIDLGGTTIKTVANGSVILSNSVIVSGNVIDGSGLSATTYANVLNAAMVANVSAANAAIITANSSMKTYVDSQVVASGGYSNVALAAYLTTSTPVYVGNIKSNTNIVANGNIIGGGVRSTSGATPPANPVPGDMWFNTTENLLYRYTTDGSSSSWIDISGPVYTFDWTSNVSFAGNLTPGANVTYYIGNQSQQYVSLYSANVFSTSLYNTGTATVGNVVTTNGVFWANGNSYSSGSSGISSARVYGLGIAYGIGL